MNRLNDLANAPSLEVALRLANDLVGAEQQISIVLLAYDGRRKIFVNAADSLEAKLGLLTGLEEFVIALNQFPEMVRKKLAGGIELIDLGAASSQYAEIFGIPPSVGDYRIYLRGVLVDNSLCAAILIFGKEVRGVTSTPVTESRVMERLELIVSLLALVYRRIAEQMARLEATQKLEELTRRLHEENDRKVRALMDQIEDLKQQSGARPDSPLQSAASSSRVSDDLEESVQGKIDRMENQLKRAFERLEEAQVDISRLEVTLEEKDERVKFLEEILALSELSDPLTS